MPVSDRKILFIVNPKAGRGRSAEVIELIKKEMPPGISYTIEKWEKIEEIKNIRGVIHSGTFTDAIAVGGDGTVNQVAKSVLNTGAALGIIPTGSGNGLARSLGLSMDTRAALKQILAGRTSVIDSGTVNSIPFFCTSGTGFDARIGHLFATSDERGLKTYIKITLLEFFRYKARNYTLTMNGEKIQRKAFLIAVANAGQYGNDFYIAPLANLHDGLFHVVVLKPFGFLTVWGLLVNILRKKAHQSRFVETYTTDRLIIERESPGEMHYDGEPALQGAQLVFENHPKSLKVLVGEKFKAS
jgi:YegS/Rv2252/BmrU family lipid kinase